MRSYRDLQSRNKRVLRKKNFFIIKRRVVLQPTLSQILVRQEFFLDFLTQCAIMMRYYHLRLFFLSLRLFHVFCFRFAVTESSEGELVVNYEIPPIISAQWITPENIKQVNPYHCIYDLNYTFSSVTVTHSCLISVPIPSENFYYYGLLHLCKSIAQLPNKLSSIESHTMFLPDSIPFRLSLWIEKLDDNPDRILDAFIQFKLANIFTSTFRFNESLQTYNFIHDFFIPIPMGFPSLFSNLTNSSEIILENTLTFTLNIYPYLLQNGNILPIQNYFWEKNTLKLQFSNLSITYLDI